LDRGFYLDFSWCFPTQTAPVMGAWGTQCHPELGLGWWLGPVGPRGAPGRSVWVEAAGRAPGLRRCLGSMHWITAASCASEVAALPPFPWTGLGEDGGAVKAQVLPPQRSLKTWPKNRVCAQTGLALELRGRASMGRAPRPFRSPPLAWECCTARRRLRGEVKMLLIKQRFEIPC